MISSLKYFGILLFLANFSSSISITTLDGIVLKDKTECEKSSKVGDECWINTEDLRPTQFSYGKDEVTCKKNFFESLSKSEIESYLEEDGRIVLAIIGPEGFFLIDGHHMSRALLEADISSDLKIVHALIVENLEDYAKNDFWEYLIDNDQVWLYDEKGSAPFAPEHLPKNLLEMMNDPFRSLSWMVKNAGGFKKVAIPFEDFLWANFFRSHINATNGELITSNNLIEKKKDMKTSDIDWSWCEVRPYSSDCFSSSILEKAFPLAMQLASSELAVGLPGFGIGTLNPPNCG